jgi:hypothetical protein
MFAAEARGEVPEGTARRWQRETPKGKKLPEKVAGIFQDSEHGLKKARRMNMDKLAFDIGVGEGMKLAAIDVRNFRILPSADSHEEEIQKAVSGHKERAKGDYGAETARTGARYGAGSAALGGLAGAGYGAALGSSVRKGMGKSKAGKGALIGAAVGAGTLGALGALGGVIKGHGRTQLAKKMDKMSPKERKRYLENAAKENRHQEMMSAMAYR